MTFSNYKGARAYRVTLMNGTEASYGFVIKSLMKSAPVETLSLSLIGFAFVMAYCLRMFEGPYSEATG